MRFNDRPHRTLAPRPGNNRVLGELTLSLPGLHGALLNTSSSPLLRVPPEAILSDTPAPAPLPCDDRAQHFTVLGPVTAPSMDGPDPDPTTVLGRLHSPSAQSNSSAMRQI